MTSSPSEGQPERWSIAPFPAWWVEREWSEEAPVQPDDHTALLLNDTQVAVAERHRCTRTVTRLLTREAVAQLSQVQLEWDPATERLELHTIAIWRGGERRDALVREHIMLRQQESEQCRGILTGRLNVLLLLEDVRPGDVLEVAWSEVETAMLEEARYDLLVPLATVSACGVWYLRVTALREAPVQWRTYGIDLPPLITECEEKVLLEWTRAKLPAARPEPLAPPWSWPVPMLQLSQFSDWGAVARCIHHAWARGREASPAVADRARRIAEEHPAQEDQITAAIEFVQSDVRYLGLSMGLDKLVPTSPDTVLRRLFGDCKDKSILLCALLAELGVKAYPVLVHTQLLRATGSLLPALHAFNHAIAAVEWEGHTVFIDGTMAGQGGRIYDRHAGIFEKGLIISETTKDLTSLPAPPRREQPLTYTEEIYLSQSGKRSRIDWNLSGAGADADFLRNAIRAHGASAFAMDELRAIQSLYPHARRNGIEEIEDDVRENTYRIRGSYFMYDWGQRTSRHWNTTGVHGRWALRSVIVPPTDRKRTLPLRLNHPSHIRHEIRLHVKKFDGMKPIRNRTVSRWFEYIANMSCRTGEVELIFEWKSLREEVAASEFLTYVKEVETALKVTGMTFTFPWFGPFHVDVPAAGEEPDRNAATGSASAPPIKPRLPRTAADDPLFEIPEAAPALATAAAAAGTAPAADPAAGVTRIRKRIPELRAAPRRWRRIRPINLLWLIPAIILFTLVIGGIVNLNRPVQNPVKDADERVYNNPRWKAAQNAVRARNLTLADNLLAELEQIEPGTPSVPGVRVGIALQKGDRAAAETFAAEAVKRAPEHYRAMSSMLDVMMLDPAKNEDTLRYADRMRLLYPQDAMPHFAAAKVKQRRHQWRESAAEWKEGLLRNPESYQALISLGQSWKGAGAADEAISALSDLIKSHPAAGLLRVEKIHLLLDRRRNDEARAEVDAAEAFLGKNPALDLIRASCSLGGASHNQAIEQIIQLTNANVDNFALLYESARAFLAAGRHAEVLQITDKVIKGDAKIPAMLLLRGASLRQRGPVNEAIFFLEQFLAVDPLEGKAWLLLAECRQMSGDANRAAECRAKAAELGWREL